MRAIETGMRGVVALGGSGAALLLALWFGTGRELPATLMFIAAALCALLGAAAGWGTIAALLGPLPAVTPKHDGVVRTEAPRTNLLAGLNGTIVYVILFGITIYLMCVSSGIWIWLTVPDDVGDVGEAKRLFLQWLPKISVVAALYHAWEMFRIVQWDREHQFRENAKKRIVIGEDFGDVDLPPFRFALRTFDTAWRYVTFYVFATVTYALAFWSAGFITDNVLWAAAGAYSLAALVMFFSYRATLGQIPLVYKLSEALRGTAQYALVYVMTAVAMWTVGAIVQFTFGFPKWVAAAASLPTGYYVWHLAAGLYFRAKVWENFREGRKRITVYQAAKEAQKAIRRGDPGIRLFGVQYPSELGLKGVLFTGRKGSGKTQLMKTLLVQLLEDVGLNRDTRAFICESKGDIVPFLFALQDEREKKGLPPLRIHILNHRHPECVGWDIQTDIEDDLELAAGIAQVFIPEEKGESKNPFFSDAARLLMTGMMQSFILTNRERRIEKKEPYRWTLRDVCLAMRSTVRMREILVRHDHTQQYIEILDRVNNDVLTTMLLKIKPYDTIAAAWQGRPLLSLKAWRDDPVGSILLIGREPEAQPAMNAFNRVFFQRMTQVVLKGPENQYGNPPKRTLLLLDEFANMGFLPGIENFITECRSKGGEVVLSFQYYSALVNIYTENIANQIVGEMQTRIHLASDGAQARWASLDIGPIQEYGQSGQQQTSPAVLETRFSRYPPANPENGITGTCISFAFDGVYEHAQPWKPDVEKVTRLTVPVSPLETPGVDRQILHPWDINELRQLDLAIELKKENVQKQAETQSQGRNDSAPPRQGATAAAQQGMGVNGDGRPPSGSRLADINRIDFDDEDTPPKTGDGLRLKAPLRRTRQQDGNMQ